MWTWRGRLALPQDVLPSSKQTPFLKHQNHHIQHHHRPLCGFGRAATQYSVWQSYLKKDGTQPSAQWGWLLWVPKSWWSHRGRLQQSVCHWNFFFLIQKCLIINNDGPCDEAAAPCLIQAETGTVLYSVQIFWASSGKDKDCSDRSPWTVKLQFFLCVCLLMSKMIYVFFFFKGECFIVINDQYQQDFGTVVILFIIRILMMVRFWCPKCSFKPAQNICRVDTKYQHLSAKLRAVLEQCIIWE